MDTGGPKGRILSVSRDEQHQWLQEHLGLERELIVGELGMTELASQRYEGSVRAHFFGEVAPRERYLGPPWLRSVALAAQSLTPCGPGEEGMLAHVDLANVEPCAFVLTADRGRVFPTALADSVELLGRVPGSEWRGCGLDVEQLLSVGD